MKINLILVYNTPCLHEMTDPRFGLSVIPTRRHARVATRAGLSFGLGRAANCGAGGRAVEFGCVTFSMPCTSAPAPVGAFLCASEPHQKPAQRDPGLSGRSALPAALIAPRAHLNRTFERIRS